MILWLITDSYILIVETMTKKVDKMIDKKEIFIIVIEPIETFLNRGTIINPIPMINKVRPLSSWNIPWRLKTDPLNTGIFTFKINANHIVPINDPIRIKITAAIIIGKNI